MELGNPMTLRSQIAVVTVAAAGILFIVWLLRRRKITEPLFYLWLLVFLGIAVVGISDRIQVALTELIDTYDPLSMMLFLALGFLFGASLVYSVLLSNLSARISSLTAYVAELRLDLDDLQSTGSAEKAGAPGDGERE